MYINAGPKTGCKGLRCDPEELQLFLKNLGVNLELRERIGALRFGEDQIRQALSTIVGPDPRAQKTEKAFHLFVCFYLLYPRKEGYSVGIELLRDADILPRNPYGLQI